MQKEHFWTFLERKVRKMKKTQETLKFTKCFLSDGVKTIGDGVMKAEVQGDGLYSESLQNIIREELVTATKEGHHEYFSWRRDGVS